MNKDLLRKGFKYLNVFMVFLWNLGLEKILNIWPKGLGQYIVITHYGRNSGRKYLTPVNYCEIDGEIYYTSGFGVQSDWYKNLRVNPNIEIWSKNSWWQALAEDISHNPERLAIMKNVLKGSGFAAPLFGLDPCGMVDLTWGHFTKDYRLLRLDRVAPQT